MAVIPSDMLFIRWRFNLMVGSQAVEQAVFGLHAHRFHRAGNNTDWPADVQEVAEKCVDAWRANTAGAEVFFPKAVKADSVEVFHQSTANKVLDKGVAPFSGAKTWAGTGDDSMPFQDSVCISLYGYPPGGFVPDRKFKRGRFFLPPLSSAQCDPAGMISTSAQDTLSQCMGGLVNAVQGMEVGSDSDSPEGADYLSAAILSVTSSAWHQVEQVGVGRVVDTQRRRRKKLAEARQWTLVNTN